MRKMKRFDFSAHYSRMSRLLVDAVRDEEILGNDAAAIGAIRFFVSVAEAETGQPVTKLASSNFRVATPESTSASFKVLVSETKWPGAEREANGFYSVTITSGSTLGLGFDKGVNYAFGVQVRRFKRGGEVVDFGQAAVTVMGVGHTVFALPESEKG